MDKKKIPSPQGRKVSAETRKAGMAAMTKAMMGRPTKKAKGQINGKEKKI